MNKTDPTGLCGADDNSDCGGGIGIFLPIFPTGGGDQPPALPTPHPVFGVLSSFQLNRRPPLACFDALTRCIDEVHKKYEELKAEQFGEYEDCLLDCVNDDGPFGLPDLEEMARCGAKCLAKYAAERTADVIGEAAEGALCSIQVGVPCFGPHGGPQ